MLLPVADETNGLAIAGIAGPSPLTAIHTEEHSIHYIYGYRIANQ